MTKSFILQVEEMISMQRMDTQPGQLNGHDDSSSFAPSRSGSLLSFLAVLHSRESGTTPLFGHGPSTSPCVYPGGVVPEIIWLSVGTSAGVEHVLFRQTLQEDA